MKNRIKLQEQGIKDTYIYSPPSNQTDFIRRHVKMPVARGVICLLIKDRQVVARGHSRCSVKVNRSTGKRDQFVKKEGRNIALGKAIQAYEFKNDTTMGEYMPTLYPDEQAILAKIIEHEEK